MKVMLVDDEILAVQHLRRLLDWESLGFAVVAEETNPKRALDSFERLLPELVIVDIKMPGMDGIEFSRRVLDKHPETKILLLTSYKEFEYAKAALTLGVENYLLKHEVGAETLLAELRRIRDAREKERLRNRLFRRELLRDVLTGRAADLAALDDRRGEAAASERRYALFLLQPDAPFLAREPRPEPADADEPFLEPPIPAALETARMEPNLWALVAAFAPEPGARNRRERLLEAASAIRQALKARGGRAAAVCAAGDFREAAELAAAYRAGKEAVRRAAAFDGAGKTLLLEDEEPAAPADRERLQGELDRAAAALAALTPDEAVRALRAAFGAAAASRDVEALRDLCERGLRLLKEFRAEYALPPLEPMQADGPLAAEAAADARSPADRLRAWFEARLREAADEARASSKLSAKVRQALDYMQKHYADDLTSDSIAGALGISGDHLRHLFKEEVGRTMLEHLTHVRMEHAKRLLAEGKHKIYEISEMVGYRSSQYFSQVFRKAVGASPNEYAESKGRPAP
ncbi:response regulator transcription factor [Paenibacillus sp.]|uniref:response regulator transcription factor n=1 Tax=Paenibacillus sp. TaxID=58172 RepID=UPI002D347356|nr:response regulator [Paenibacillus sp.]HZG83717.1 response regulator [Paenibacillus sp.]